MVARISGESVTRVAVMPGELSVSPYTLMMSLQYIFSITCFIVSIGQGAPAMMPVRSELRSNMSNIGWFSSAMNIVGTP